MAVSGRRKNTSSKTLFTKEPSEEWEIFCNPCLNNEELRPADGYCEFCEEHFCSECLKVHRNQTATKNHAILTGDEIPKEQSLDTAQEPCDRHPTEIIKYFCPHHDIIGCGDCMVLDHKPCKVERIHDVSKRYMSEEALSEFKQCIDKLESDITRFKSELVENIKSVNESNAAVITEINKFRKEISDSLDKIQDELLASAEIMRKEDKQVLKSLEHEIDDMELNLKDIKSKIQSHAKEINSCFVTTKKAGKKITHLQQNLKTIRSRDRTVMHRFDKNADLQNIVEKANSLGDIYKSILAPLKTDIYDEELKFAGEIYAKSDSDELDCRIADCLLKSEKNLLVTDLNNKCVKLINLESNTIESICSFDTAPFGITAVENNTVAVAIPGCIQLVSVDEILAKTERIKVSGACYGIAYKDGMFAVSFCDPSRVNVIDVHGKVLHTLEPQTGNKNVLEDPEYVVFGYEPDTVIVSDLQANKIVLVNFKGEILRAFEDNQLRGPRGLYMMKDGTVLACNYGKYTHNILVLSRDWTNAKYILGVDENIGNPQCIDFCESNKRLFVGNAWKNVVRIFQFM